MAGPLTGTRVVELVGLGPGPFCGMVLSDLGARVVRVDRAEVARATDRSRPATNAMHRSKAAIGVDLKSPQGVETFLRLTDASDALIDVFRPGVCERLGIGPEVACARNPQLVYGRLTGYGQDGPLADAAGHDIDYLAVAGALEPLGRAGQPPTPPINVLGDFAGGGMLLALGVVAALHARHTTGRGQVVDAAMVDGAALMLTPFYAARASGFWGERGTNMLDTGAPYYEVYACADGNWIAVGAIEPPFYAALLAVMNLDADSLPDRDDPANWITLKERFASVFATKTRDEWSALANGRDTCLAPVLTPLEAPHHEHNVARRTFLELHGVPQPAPAPRFSDTALPNPEPAVHPGESTAKTLADWGFTEDEVAKLVDAGVLV